MSSGLSKNKRKLSIFSPSDGLLHIPDSWRGKRSRSTSRAASPIDSGASTPGERFSPPGGQVPPPNLNQGNTSSLQIADSGPSFEAGKVEAGIASQLARRIPWAGLEKALQNLCLTTEICPPLHSAIDALKSSLHAFEVAARTSEDYDELASGLRTMIELLGNSLRDAASEEIANTIVTIVEKIKKEIEGIEEYMSQSRRRRTLGALRDEEDVIRRYRRIEQLFCRLQGEASMSSWNIANKLLINTQLESLRPAKLASFDSEHSVDVGRRACTKNTRVDILNDSTTWADDPNGKKIFWMNGMAGTGKTTIAYSLCERLEGTGQLAASFFCTRTSPECREAKRIIPTIAYQLARISSPFRQALCGELNHDADIGTRNPSKQFERLLVVPLLQARSSMASNLVVVIDALDECDNPGVVEHILKMLFHFSVNCPLKFFVTSRPEPAIRNKIITEHNRLASICHLHEIEKSLVQTDIELYLKDELEHMLPSHCNNIEELAIKSGNLFIYASTAVRHIQPPGKAVNSEQRLKAILAIGKKSNGSLSGIDELYSVILDAAINDKERNDEERNDIKIVLSTVICAYEPVIIKTLAVLCGLDDGYQINSALEPLRSVLHVSEHNNLVTTLHASFPDFMLSQESSRGFFCDRSSHDQFLAARCMEIMKSKLRFNICNLKSSYVIDDSIPGLKESIETHISQDLFYACRFWVDHLSRGSATDLLIEMVQEFLSQRLLFWMEVLNLNRCMVIGAVASTKLHMWLQATPTSSGLSGLVTLAHDAQTFVGNYTASKVSSSTPHLYLSALPLSSPTNLIRGIYRQQFKGLIEATGTLMHRIDRALLDIWESSSAIRSISYSADGTQIVISDKMGRIIVREAQNGNKTLDFRAHKMAISSVAFSSCGTQVVSGSYDKTVCVWNTRNGKRIYGPFTGHSGLVNSVGFSPDDKFLVSGSEDSTVRVWVKDRTRPPDTFSGHGGAVNSVAFSPDGTKIVSGSSDHAVFLWDVTNGECLSRLEGHSQSVEAVRFSPCGAFVVSGSNDHTIRVWNVSNTATPSCLRTLCGHSHWVTSISVSPEGDRIVSGSLDTSVRVWHKGSGACMALFKAHTNSVRSVDFSPDGARVISASEDKHIGVWNVQGRTDSDKTVMKKIGIIDVSRDSAYIGVSSGDKSGIVEIWDTQNGQQISHLPIQPARSHLVKFLNFSPDGESIFVGYKTDFGAINVCNTPTLAIPRPNDTHGFSQHTLANTSGRITLSPLLSFSNASGSNREPGLLEESIHYARTRLQEPVGFAGSLSVPDLAAFSLDGTCLITTTTQSTIWAWSTHDGQLIAGPLTISDQYHPIVVIDISFNGTRIVANSDPCTLRIRNVRDEMRSKPLIGHACLICKAEFSVDQKCVASIDSSNIVFVWDALSGDRIKRLEFTAPTVGSLHKEVTFRFFSNGIFSLCWVSRYGDAIHYRWVQTGFDPQSRAELVTEPDGWLLDGGNLVVWVPPEIRNEFPGSSGITIGKTGSLRVSYDKTLCGDDWAKCYIGDQVNGEDHAFEEI